MELRGTLLRAIVILDSILASSIATPVADPPAQPQTHQPQRRVRGRATRRVTHESAGDAGDARLDSAVIPPEMLTPEEMLDAD